MRVKSARRGCRRALINQGEVGGWGNHKSKLRAWGKKYLDFTNKYKKICKP